MYLYFFQIWSLHFLPLAFYRVDEPTVGDRSRSSCSGEGVDRKNQFESRIADLETENSELKVMLAQSVRENNDLKVGLSFRTTPVTCVVFLRQTFLWGFFFLSFLWRSSYLEWRFAGPVPVLSHVINFLICEICLKFLLLEFLDLGQAFFI